MAMTSHTPAPSPTADPAPDIRPGRRHRARWGWLGLAGVALIVNVALVTSLIMGRSPGSAAGDPSSPRASDARSPLDAVGTRLSGSPCIASRLIWTSSTRIACGTWSATVTADSTIATVSLYAAGRDGYQQYAGTLPLSLHWGDTLADVSAELGAPRVIYTSFGAPRLVYSIYGQAYRALELQFDSHDTLVEISATLTL